MKKPKDWTDLHPDKQKEYIRAFCNVLTTLVDEGYITVVVPVTTALFTGKIMPEIRRSANVLLKSGKDPSGICSLCSGAVFNNECSRCAAVS